jgi:hypothetical protein
LKRHHVIILLCAAAVSFGAGVEQPVKQPRPVPQQEDGHRPWVGQFLYGLDLLTDDERRSFWATMRRLRTYDEQLAHWRAHVTRMRDRARERGLTIDEPPEVMAPGERQRLRRPVIGREMMTIEEVEAYRAHEVSLTPEEQESFRREHFERMQRRADERGLVLHDPTEELK